MFSHWLRRHSLLTICYQFLLLADKLTNHCLHCHVFTKAPLPCEVTDTCNDVYSCCLHARHAVQWCFARRTVAGRRARVITGSQESLTHKLAFSGMSVRWGSMSFFPWRARICLATFLHWGGLKSASLFLLLSKTAIPGQSLRGIWTTSSTTSKCLRWPSTWSSLIHRAAGVHWHGGTHLSNGRNLLQRGLQGSHEPGLN